MNKILFPILLLISLSGAGQNFFWSHTGGNDVVDVNYGYLYNSYAASDTRKISSSDSWIIPTLFRNDTMNWSHIIAFLDDSYTYGGDLIDSYAQASNKMRETGTDWWTTPNTGATNEVGFNARGAGQRSYFDGAFTGINSSLCLFYNPNSFPSMKLVLITSGSLDFSGTTDNVSGRSIRLVNINTTLSSGESGTYTGNDGKVYRTICINGVEWLADNLCETKYRNGDWITGYDGGVYSPISDASWAALTTEAMCAYDDDETNAINP